MRNTISFNLGDAHNAVIYTLKGDVLVRADDHEQNVNREHAVPLFGTGSSLSFGAFRRTHFAILSGADIREPVVADGPFIMNERSQIKSAFARYQAGEMGHLQAL